MPSPGKFSEEHVALGALIIVAIWIYGVLPFVFLLPHQGEWWNKLWTDPNATFAGAVALFTLALVCVGVYQGIQLQRTVEATKTAANAALRQAKATVALESPIPEIVEIKLVEYADTQDRIGKGDHIIPGPLPELCRPLVHLRNIGRTYIYFERFCCDWIISESLPQQPVYRRIRTFLGALPPNMQMSDQVTWFVDYEDLIILTEVQRNAIRNKTQFLWIFGYFSYYNFLGDRNVAGFLGRWDVDHGLSREPNQQYEYRSQNYP